MTEQRYRGSFTALATPFAQGAIDEAAFTRLIERQLAAGTRGLVVCGSTGEAPALTAEEHRRMVCLAVGAAGGAIPVFAGCGAASTAAAVELAVAAAKAGADGLLCAAPPYVRPTQEGLIAHVSAVADAAGLPVMLYDVPGRTAVGFSDDSIVRLVESEKIVALKDATGDLSRPLRLRARVGDALAQLTGEDATVPGYLAMSGDGCVSVTANVVPELCTRLHRAWHRGDLPGLAAASARLAPITAALFAESNPIPLKAALAALGLARDELRLPLLPASAATRRAIAAALDA